MIRDCDRLQSPGQGRLPGWTHHPVSAPHTLSSWFLTLRTPRHRHAHTPPRPSSPQSQDGTAQAGRVLTREMCVPPGVGGLKAGPTSNQRVALSLVLTAGQATEREHDWATSALGTLSLVPRAEEAGVNTGSFHSPACQSACLHPTLPPCPSGLVGSPRTPVGRGCGWGTVGRSNAMQTRGGREGAPLWGGTRSPGIWTEDSDPLGSLAPGPSPAHSSGPQAEPRWGRLPLGPVPDLEALSCYLKPAACLPAASRLWMALSAGNESTLLGGEAAGRHRKRRQEGAVRGRGPGGVAPQPAWGAFP